MCLKRPYDTFQILIIVWSHYRSLCFRNSLLQNFSNPPSISGVIGISKCFFLFFCLNDRAGSYIGRDDKGKRRYVSLWVVPFAFSLPVIFKRVCKLPVWWWVHHLPHWCVAAACDSHGNYCSYVIISLPVLLYLKIQSWWLTSSGNENVYC